MLEVLDFRKGVNQAVNSERGPSSYVSESTGAIELDKSPKKPINNSN